MHREDPAVAIKASSMRKRLSMPKICFRRPANESTSRQAPVSNTDGKGIVSMHLRSPRSAVSVWFAALIAIAANTIPAAGLQTENADEIVARADRIRFPSHAFQVDVSVTTTASGEQSDARAYRILSKSNDNTIVQVTSPAIDRGQLMLMKGHDLWVFMPNISQAIRLPLSQRLTGQVANGDLARANFTGDYKASLLRTDKLEGKSYYLLELNAIGSYVTYHRVLYWVDRSTYRPHKAEFYTRSGKLLKTAYYKDFKDMEGEKRPTKLVIQNALREDEQSVLVYRNMRLRNLPDKIFTKDYLKKLR
jgi:outer membrane lipoprotein-sorting protein